MRCVELTQRIGYDAFANPFGNGRYLRTPAIQSGANRLVLTTLMFAVSSSRHKNALLARERFRMAATEQGRRHNHQNDG
jgi:hypothetical protein